MTFSDILFRNFSCYNTARGWKGIVSIPVCIFFFSNLRQPDSCYDLRTNEHENSKILFQLMYHGKFYIKCIYIYFFIL